MKQVGLEGMACLSLPTLYVKDIVFPLTHMLDMFKLDKISRESILKRRENPYIAIRTMMPWLLRMDHTDTCTHNTHTPRSTLPGISKSTSNNLCRFHL